MSENVRNTVNRYQNTSRSAAVRGLYPSSSMAGPTSHRQSRNRLTKPPPRERSISRDRWTRHELRDSRPRETRSRMPNYERGTTSRPPNLHGGDFGRIADHQADRAARRRREDEQLLRTLVQDYQDTRDLTEAQLRIAFELSREEERLREVELDIEMRSLAIAAQEAQARRNRGLNARYCVEGVTDDEELQIALLASADQSSLAWSVEVPAARGSSWVEGLSEDEELQFALLASADHSVPARLTDGLREDDELQPGLLASEDQATPTGLGPSGEEYLSDEEPQLALPASEHESTVPRSVQVSPAQRPSRDGRLSEDEELRPALRASEDQLTPSQSLELHFAQELTRGDGLSENGERQVDLLASEDQSAATQSVEVPLARGPTQDERTPSQLQSTSSGCHDRAAEIEQTPSPSPLPPSTEARPKSSNSRDQDSADLQPLLQHIASESSNTPDRVRTPLPAPIPLSGRQPEWLRSDDGDHSSSTDGAHRRIQNPDSPARSGGSKAPSVGQTTPGLAAASAHNSRTSLSSPLPSIGQYPTEPVAPHESHRIAVVFPERYVQPERPLSSPQQTSSASSPSDISLGVSQPAVSSHQPSGDRRTSSPASQPMSIGTPVSSSHPSHVLLVQTEEPSAAIPQPVTNALEDPSLSSVQDPFTNISQPMVFNGPVAINNIVVNNGPESRTGLLKRALSQSYKLVKKKTSDAAGAKSSANGGSRSSILYQVQSSLSGLDLKLGLKSSNSNRFPLDIEDDDEENRAPSPDPSLLGKLDLAEERLQSSDESIHRSRSGRVSGVSYVRAEVDRNGSPVPMRSRELHLVTPRTPSRPSPPARRPVPPPKPSTVSGCAGSNGSRADQVGEAFHDSAVGLSKVSFNSRPEVLAPALRAGDQQLPQPGVGHTPQTPPFSIRRRPVASASFTPVPSVQEAPQQFPLITSQVDGPRTETPDSLYASPDSPQYMKATLARKHVHPPMNTEWANVPPAGQKLEHLNSRAMMDIDRFRTRRKNDDANSPRDHRWAGSGGGGWSIDAEHEGEESGEGYAEEAAGCGLTLPADLVLRGANVFCKVPA